MKSVIFLESSEMYFYLVASKIGAKFNNLVIYGDTLVNFQIFGKNFEYKIDNISKPKISKIGKNCFFPSFQNIMHLFGSKTQFGHFLSLWEEGGGGGGCMSLTRKNPVWELNTKACGYQGH